jgi:hypothetical protein
MNRVAHPALGSLAIVIIHGDLAAPPCRIACSAFLGGWASKTDQLAAARSLDNLPQERNLPNLELNRSQTQMT